MVMKKLNLARGGRKISLRFCLRLTSALILMSLATSCAPDRGSTLGRIDALTERDADLALDTLKTLEGTHFSEADRNHYELLKIKAADKLYIRHQSDSVILGVINYYKKHPKGLLYAEALYYGGRVYSDMGDYPMALKYFQRADSAMPEIDRDSPQNLRLHGNISGHLSHTLGKLNMSEQSIPALEKALLIDSLLNDTLNFVHDLSSRGFTSAELQDYGTAKKYYAKARQYAQYVSEELAATMDMRIAGLIYKERDYDSALSIIRDIPEKVDTLNRNLAYSYAVALYDKAGIRDTAFMYAKKLRASGLNNNKSIAYQTMLKPEYRQFVPTDSLYGIADEFHTYLSKIFASSTSDQPKIQDSVYN